MAMGQNPNRTPSKHPNPTTRPGSKLGGEFTYPRMLPLTHTQPLVLTQSNHFKQTKMVGAPTPKCDPKTVLTTTATDFPNSPRPRIVSCRTASPVATSGSFCKKLRASACSTSRSGTSGSSWNPTPTTDAEMRDLKPTRKSGLPVYGLGLPCLGGGGGLLMLERQVSPVLVGGG